jgi:hypothetical protein
MALKKREKMMLAAVGAVLAIAALVMFWPSSDGSSADPGEELKKVAAELQKEQLKDKELRPQLMEKKLQEWRRRSLPAEPEVARSLYNTWLTDLFVNKVKFHNVKVNYKGQSQSPHKNYFEFSYGVQCQGTLEQLTRFFYDFYSSGQMHKIQSYSIKPAEGGKSLELDIDVEAMSMKSSTQKGLSTEAGKRLKLAKVEDYTKVIAGRNVFAPYSPPIVVRGDPGPVRPADPPAAPPKFDPTKYTYLTGITEADQVLEAWLTDRTSGKKINLREGQPFAFGSTKGVVKRIGLDDIEVEIDGKKYTVKLGESLKKQ